MDRQGEATARVVASPCALLSASRADQLLLPLLPQGERPIEQGQGCGLGLAAPALGLHRLLGQELRPREQRLLRSGASPRWPLPVSIPTLASFPSVLWRCAWAKTASTVSEVSPSPITTFPARASISGP